VVVIGGPHNGTPYSFHSDKFYRENNIVCQLIHSTGNLITSRGPGTALEFAFAIVDKLVGSETVDTLKKAMLFKE
jgi:hypothetical protein